MSNAARIGDDTSGICDIGLDCCPHGRVGITRTGSNNVFINGIGAHRVNDIGEILACAHKPPILYFNTVRGSQTVFINGRNAANVGTVTRCQICGSDGHIDNGSPNVFIGG